MEKVVAMIVAGGQGTRMGLEIKKQYLLLDGKEVLAHTIEKFHKMNEIHELIVVVAKEDISFVKENICGKYGFHKVKKVVAGGKERQDSVRAGLDAIEEAKYVVIHDGARPFINTQIILNALHKVKEVKACIVGVPLKDTIKECEVSSKKILNTPNRDQFFCVQTPQVFEKELLIQAYAYAKENKISATDDSALVEKMGKDVFIIEGDYANIKITTQEDLLFAELILQSEKKQKK
jgi:2-C-methyl-D-erythritol 4-phosphate cytidylyltransferase